MLPQSIDDWKLKDFLPESELVLPEHQVDRPRFLAIDAHNHLRDRAPGGEAVPVWWS